MKLLFGAEDECIGSIHDQLAHLLKIKGGMPPALGSVQMLTREQLSSLIETAFWVSLNSNEGRPIRISAAVGQPELFTHALTFATDVPYERSQIVKLAPAIPRSSCLIVSPTVDGLSIRGFAESRPGPWVDTVTVSVLEPGTLRVGVGPFRSYAVLQGHSNSILAAGNFDLASHLQRMLRKSLPQDDILETQAIWRECLALEEIARMILAHEHGGMVLIVPDSSGDWLQSLSSFPYQFALPDTTIRDVIRQELQVANTQGQTFQKLSEANIPEDVRNIAIASMGSTPWGGMGKGARSTASLANIDGAVVVTRDLQVLGFGAKITIETGNTPNIFEFEPKPGMQELMPKQFEDLGGTRHQSAARFAANNKDSVVLVFSQDGHMSVMNWQEPINGVAVLRNTEWWV